MLEQIIGLVPERWRELVQLVLAPIVWIPRLQEVLVDFFLESSSPWTAAAKYLFLLLPALLGVAAIWCTQLAIYTLPFRSGRARFISVVLLAWWDAARAVWLYWVGAVRVAAVAAGWLFALARLGVRLGAEAARQLIAAPMAMTGMMTRSYFQPGVPWIALLMLVFWCVLEAAVFTYTLRPTVTEVLADLVGADEVGRFTGPILYFLLLLMIMGSFACVHTLVDAVRRREFRFVTQMVLVELFVMLFEVMFLYRELVDAITPWIAQQTGARPGLAFTLFLAAFGWIGVRGMTWFLFGQYGTPPLLAFISRRPLADADLTAPTGPGATPPAWWRAPVEDLRGELGWLHERSDQLLEYLALPALHLLAAALNFAMVLTAARPVFSLPFKGLKEVTETRDIMTALQLQPRKQVSL
ncbi:MAG TPA: hypothetical protein VFX28_16535 [Methylomirabilota bacterium]|nr:hypothetical protein [Methylomirabilota bacterium]